jgi:L-seryl-tRNA(Ser) seleniumtransferase
LFHVLSASLDNLRQRAERLAPQLALAPDVEFADVIATSNCLGIGRFAHWNRPSYAIALAAANGDVAALDERLRNASLPVVGRRQEDRLLVDLLTVLPRQDLDLVEMVVGPVAAGLDSAETPRTANG